MKIGKSIGIDLGTTNSVIAYCESGEPRILASTSGKTFTPSVISYQRVRIGDDRMLIGQQALNNAARAPKETIFSVKRLMGRSFDEPQVAEYDSRFPCSVETLNNDLKVGLWLNVGGRELSPGDVSSHILTNLREAAELGLNDDVTHAVITVPAYFEERQRAATREAAEQAGLIITKIIDEPTAAAIAYGMAQGENGQRIIVYDLGGGTFDISIIQWAGDRFEVRAIGGDSWLGGDDFDQVIVELIESHLLDEFGFELRSDASAHMLARQHAEKAKIALSTVEEFELLIPGIARTDSRLIDVELVIKRAWFNRSIEHYVDRTVDILQQLLDEQGLEPADFECLLLVGGSTATPLVRDKLTQIFGSERVRRHSEPMHCVALGAAILASDLESIKCLHCGNFNVLNTSHCDVCSQFQEPERMTGGIKISEVTARSLGIGCKDDVYAIIIPRGKAYPLKAPITKVFRPSVHQQTGISVPVYEGEDSAASKNSLQGAINFEVDPPMPIDTPIFVIFNYDRDRILDVTIRPQGRQEFHTRLARLKSPLDFGVVLDTPSSAWKQDLAATLEIAGQFLSQCSSLITESHKADLAGNIEMAKQTLQESRKESAADCIDLLNRRIYYSGIASQVFVAERMADDQASEIKSQIISLCSEMRNTFPDQMQRCVAASGKLESLLNQIVSDQQEVS